MQQINQNEARELFKILDQIKSCVGAAQTTGLNKQQLETFKYNTNLLQALSMATELFPVYQQYYADILKLTEQEVIKLVQKEYLNFYSVSNASPYLPLAANGPWIITCYGAVVYDTGGYGMLGQGHNPDFIYQTIAKPQVMANIMTPNFAQYELGRRLKKEIGRNRSGGCPFEKFICLNSGSEAMTFAMRMADLNAGCMTETGAPYAGWGIKKVALKGAFHGRTDRPASVSDSSFESYKVLASFRNYNDTIIVEPNDLDQLKNMFTMAKQQKHFIECVVLEPVLGEGNPGLAITPEFYKLAYDLVKAQDGYLIIDSIQAGLRAQGLLSIVDYPGFENLPAPDCESYSKALNAAQFPLSVLALSKSVAESYRVGIYGNTMTTNPRALLIGCGVLDALTDQVRVNIVERGQEFVSKLEVLQRKYPELILKVQGTGLLVSAELAAHIKVYGYDSIEDSMRRSGVNVIHGGKNALRFTPHFAISSEEIDLMIAVVELALQRYL